MTQLILSSLDSDEVNSISDTVEAEQVARLIKSVYYDLATDLNLPEHNTLFQLDPSGDVAKPCLMTVPDNVTRIEVVQYDKKVTGDTYPDFQKILFMPFEEFVQYTQSLRENTTDVGSMLVTHSGDDFTILYRNNIHPTYYTTADDQQLIFDSYDDSVDTTLQNSKTMCMGTVYPAFTLSDSFYPDLDPTQFSLLINRAKVRAFQELKQMRNAEAEGEARRQRIIVQKRMNKIKLTAPIFRAPRYGR